MGSKDAFTKYGKTKCEEAFLIFEQTSSHDAVAKDLNVTWNEAYDMVYAILTTRRHSAFKRTAQLVGKKCHLS